MRKTWPCIGLALLVLAWVVTADCYPGTKSDSTWDQSILLPVAERNRTVGDKGIGLSYGHLEDVCKLKASWYYHWEPYPPMGAMPCWAEAVPQYYIPSQVGRGIGGSSDWVMMFNEPGELDPSLCAEKYVEALGLHPNKKFTSPCISHTQMWWLDAWHAALPTGTRIDALCVHCYGLAADCVGFVGQAVQRAAAWGVPEVWVPEFNTPMACNLSATEQWAEVEAMIDWFEASPVVTRYALFAARVGGYEHWCAPSVPPEGCREFMIPGALNYTSGELTFLGWHYAQAGQ